VVEELEEESEQEEGEEEEQEEEEEEEQRWQLRHALSFGFSLGMMHLCTAAPTLLLTPQPRAHRCRRGASLTASAA
jgi:hypothetical protein